MKYNKLVRDKIPEIIADSGQKATFRVLTQSEYIEYLEKKLDEEVAEFHESKDIEELVDIWEVILAMASVKGTSAGCLSDKRQAKYLKNGGFGKRILLLDIEDGGNHV